MKKKSIKAIIDDSKSFSELESNKGINFIANFMRRKRHLIEKDCFGDNIILTDEDFSIIDDFCKSHKIMEGQGSQMVLAYIINYYKNKSLEVKH